MNQEPPHTHKFDPMDSHSMRPEGECPRCDQLWQDIRAKLPADPFQGLS